MTDLLKFKPHLAHYSLMFDRCKYNVKMVQSQIKRACDVQAHL